MKQNKLLSLTAAVIMIGMLASGCGDSEPTEITTSPTEVTETTVPETTVPEETTEPTETTTEPSTEPEVESEEKPSSSQRPSNSGSAQKPKPAENTPKPTTPKPTEPKPTEPPHVHSWSDWKTVKEPSTSEEGQQQRSCSCGATESQSIAKLPMPALDLKAAMAQGNAYAQSQYGWYIDTSFNPDISGYEPPYDMDLQRTTEKGQQYLNRRMRESVDALYSSLCADPDGPDGYTINCVIREVNGVLWLYVCY